MTNVLDLGHTESVLGWVHCDAPFLEALHGFSKNSNGYFLGACGPKNIYPPKNEDRNPKKYNRMSAKNTYL